MFDNNNQPDLTVDNQVPLEVCSSKLWELVSMDAVFEENQTFSILGEDRHSSPMQKDYASSDTSSDDQSKPSSYYSQSECSPKRKRGVRLPANVDPKKRHLFLEKVRRQEMNDKYAELRMLCNVNSQSKAMILQGAVDALEEEHKKMYSILNTLVPEFQLEEEN
jgi:hypothetical protein